jgi:hypothetical protein
MIEMNNSNSKQLTTTWPGKLDTPTLYTVELSLELLPDRTLSTFFASVTLERSGRLSACRSYLHRSHLLTSPSTLRQPFQYYSDSYTSQKPQIGYFLKASKDLEA